MTSEVQLAMLPLALRTLLAALFLYIYRRKREPYLLLWAVGWTLLALQYLVRWLWLTPGESAPLPQGLESLLLAFGLLVFLDSARIFSRGEGTLLATMLLGPLFLAWVGLRVYVGGVFATIPLEAGVGFLGLMTAGLYWREGRRREFNGGRLLSLAFLFWGLALVVAPFVGSLAPLQSPFAVFLFNLLPRQLVAFGMLIVLYEEEKRIMERHMLGLAGLNLITSTAAQGATVQEMLGHTLERLLGALRVPAGTVAIRLQEGDSFSCIHRGAEGVFLRELETLGLIPFLHRMVARLGGLVVLPEVNAPATPAAFAQDEEFVRVARQARAEGIRLLVGVNLRAKSGDSGLLLLASPESRRFTPAELRLLLGLGGQIGMAVENFRLMQQSTRRSEEMRLLNEIGRTLSSSRNFDELLERMHAEMQKLLDVSNFYIALYDPLKEEVSFELEVKGGSFLPKRRRRVRNGLTEYILRHKEPLLIREDFTGVMTRLGVEPGRTAKSFCAVPILLHGEALGVIGIVSYTQERVFDEEHIEVLTILAAQAAVAMENARLFAEEQRRARQLALLNNVSRKAISTFNPEEMLAAIAAEIHASLPYDHLGLGVLDYATREVVIQAEAGHGAQGLNRRIKLGEGCIGQVAMTATSRQIDNLAEFPNPGDCQPILPDAQSLLVLPIVYADQLLGVFNVESRKPRAFREEDVLLLRTLADQIASALHNAFVFQKTQEQAITDGLTGVKTHRFFMEALNGEWRRATRVDRSFSLLLLDLDKFKFVNDYFGHLEGDMVLQRVGRILDQSVRRSDVVARYGGDEFVVLMPETNSEQAYRLADKLREWLAADPLLREKKITASVGIASYPQHANTPPELIQIADASMYLSKHRGGNMIVSADHYKLSEQKQWQRNVLEAYLGVTIKRLFATGPEAFEEVYHRLEQVIDSLGVPGEWQELPAPVLETVTALAFAIDAKDHYTQGHSQNVARLCTTVACHLNLTEKETEEIRLAAVLHDVGKIGIPERILNKPAGLDADEFEIMKEHAMLGAKILEPLQSIQNIQKIVRHHHERWDGSGYPEGMAGEDIPLASRLIAIADAYDTMTTERTYKRSRSRVEATEELRRCAGSQFDPKLIEAFVRAIPREASAEVNEVKHPSA